MDQASSTTNDKHTAGRYAESVLGTGSSSGTASPDADQGGMFSPMGDRQLTDLAQEDWEQPLAMRLGLTPIRPPLNPIPLRETNAPSIGGLFSVRTLCAGSTFVLQPDQYEVILAVDTREKGHKNDKGIIGQKLMAMGVDVVVRPLPLGDFLWIAREKAVPVPGQLCLPTRRELVLDYVVERKRMDDLVCPVSKSAQSGQPILE